jgi:hypothetical protein
MLMVLIHQLAEMLINIFYLTIIMTAKLMSIMLVMHFISIMEEESTIPNKGLHLRISGLMIIVN